MSKKADALNGAKARIVTLERAYEGLEGKYAQLQGRCVVAERRFESALSELENKHAELANCRGLNASLIKKLETARIWAVVFGLLLVTTIGTIAGGVFA